MNPNEAVKHMERLSEGDLVRSERVCGKDYYMAKGRGGEDFED